MSDYDIWIFILIFLKFVDFLHPIFKYISAEHNNINREGEIKS